MITDIEYRIEQSWMRIMRETSDLRAGRPVANSRSIVSEFADLTDVTKVAIDQSWTYVLEICRAKALRPEKLVPRAATAIAFFTKGLVLYANDRSVAAAAFGASNQIDVAGRAATNTLARHLDVTTREALVGYAGGSAIYPQSQWPLTRLQAAKAKVGKVGIFLAGAASGAILKRLAELFLP